MPEVEVKIGGRGFTVSCQPGEDRFLTAAAAILDAEAAPLVAQSARIPESRMLLMAGLMVADRMAGLEDQVRGLEARLREIESRPAPAPQRVEVMMIPPGLSAAMAELAARTESLADAAEEAMAIRGEG